MSDTATADHPEPLTLEKVYRELQVLRKRVEDLEDLRYLGEAIAENAGKRGLRLPQPRSPERGISLTFFQLSRSPLC